MFRKPNLKDFEGSDLAKAAEKAFGCKAETFTVKMKYTCEVKNFLRKIEIAHRRAAKSKLLFKY